jgi:GT2 family glycosyltransferase
MRSVLDQPRVRCDYIVQDGGSTDGSVEIIGNFAARLHAGESARDHGQADAIARGFAKSTGAPTDLMAWLNSDDFYLSGALACVADYFARHPDVDVLYGNRVVVDETSHEIGRWFLPKHDPLVLRLNDYVPQETLFWRRRVWDAVGGIDPTLKFAMDWDLLLRFDRAGAKIVHVPHFLACFRAHAAQKTASVLHDLGQREIDALRCRTFGRALSPLEVERHPRLTRYLRRSARIEFLRRHLRIHPS